MNSAPYSSDTKALLQSCARATETLHRLGSGPRRGSIGLAQVASRRQASMRHWSLTSQPRKVSSVLALHRLQGICPCRPQLAGGRRTHTYKFTKYRYFFSDWQGPVRSKDILDSTFRKIQRISPIQAPGLWRAVERLNVVGPLDG